MNTKYVVTKGLYGTEPEVKLYHTEVGDERALFACEIIKQHALVTADDGGEDSSGRQKARLQTTEEIVTKACDIAEEAFSQFARRGWMVELPDLAELHAEHARKREAEKEAERSARSTARV